jgi:predicted AAA+ superfamily ATPase
MGPLDRPEEVEGIAYESLLLQELMLVNDYSRLNYKIFYWRTADNNEVDFVLYGEKGLKAFEVKRTSRVAPAHLKGLKSFLSDYPLAKAYFIYGGERRMQEGNIEIIPFAEAVKALPSLLA